MQRTEAIIGSMTRQERERHTIIDASRKTRIAGGSGSTIGEVNQLLRQYEQMKKMMSQMNRGGGLFGGMARKMAGGLAGGLGNMLGGGGSPLATLGGGSAIDYSDDEPNSSSKGIRKKKRHKKRK